jgi:alkaline phosphatase
LNELMLSTLEDRWMREALAVATLIGALAWASVGHAQTIYPLDKAEILAGSRFDVKVEFPAGPAPQDIAVTIDGAVVDSVLGQKASVIEKEDGSATTSY